MELNINGRYWHNFFLKRKRASIIYCLAFCFLTTALTSSESKLIVYPNAVHCKFSLSLGVETAPIIVNKFGKLAAN